MCERGSTKAERGRVSNNVLRALRRLLGVTTPVSNRGVPCIRASIYSRGLLNWGGDSVFIVVSAGCSGEAEGNFALRSFV